LGVKSSRKSSCTVRRLSGDESQPMQVRPPDSKVVTLAK